MRVMFSRSASSGEDGAEASAGRALWRQQGKPGVVSVGAVFSRADTDCFSMRKVTQLKPLP